MTTVRSLIVTKIMSFEFCPDSTTQTVLAKKNEKNGRFYFEEENGFKFIWMAQVKQLPSLRTAEDIGRQMTRIGFDEFEPFRV